MTYQPTLDMELIIDNFAGGGGASEGIEIALERPVNIAINHDPQALAMHEVNHPLTRHYCEDVWDIDPREVCQGRPVALAWFSPDCKHFSKAKGGKPVEKKIRGLAWVAIRWAATVKPRIIMLENVEEFVTWGPILENGLPCPERKGQTFTSFVNALRRLGYHVEWKELRACDYGAPTIRKRLFLIARRDGLPIIWPAPTHGHPDKIKGTKLKPWRTAAECIDWSIPCPSIFERSRPLADNTMRRIARGIQKFVIDAQEPFIVPVCYGEAAGQEPRTCSLHDPVPTIVGKGTHALVMPYLTEHANASGQRIFAADEPLRTQCAQVKGGHFALCAAFLAQHNTQREGFHPGRAASDPLATITARGTQTQLVTSHIMKMRGTNIGHGTDEPLHTITSSGCHHAEVRAFLLKYYGNDKEPHGLTDPLGTVTTKDRFGLVTIHGEDYAIVDIGMRMLTPRELYRAQGFPDDYIIDRMTRGEPLTKTAQVRMCGNSVSPVLSCALAKANVPPALLVRQEQRA